MCASLLPFSIPYKIGYNGGGDYGGNGYSSYERNRPYGPPQAVDISNIGNHGFYDSYESQNGLDWQQNNYGGAWNDKINVNAISTLQYSIEQLISDAHFSLFHLAFVQIEFHTDRGSSITGNRSCIDCEPGVVAIGHCSWKTTPATRYCGK